uniref:Uncharacterized protein n=1 Tax=Physcomitrium patens TaxID=3218 RepID=A0A2K1KQ95_PHYPA|nr:hypothetical protein PHYPA_006844 [Physcomitrium patens]
MHNTSVVQSSMMRKRMSEALIRWGGGGVTLCDDRGCARGFFHVCRACVLPWKSLPCWIMRPALSVRTRRTHSAVQYAASGTWPARALSNSRGKKAPPIVWEKTRHRTTVGSAHGRRGSPDCSSTSKTNSNLGGSRSAVD